MLRKLPVAMLVVGLCLMGITPVLAQKVYSTLAEYEKLTGKKIEKFNEAPSLKIKVAAGELPPVEERLPEEPMVVEPLEEIGQYGGILKVGATDPNFLGQDIDSARTQSLFRLTPDLKNIVPNIAKGWYLSEDMKTLDIYLRKGMKWSDGHSFTADDFLFWYEDVLLNNELTPVKPKEWSPGGELMKVEKVNDYTVRLRFSAPYPRAIERLIGSSLCLPKHYLKKYHIKYNPKANELAKEEGYDHWWQCFEFHTGQQGDQDPDLPTLNPWSLKSVDTYGNKYYRRNPYYWKVDTAGNQLPYIDGQDRILVENVEILNLKSIAGEFSYSSWQLHLKDYPLYKKGEKKGKYRTMLFPEARASELGFAFNYTHKDPVLKKIFNDIRWRQAMSLAINRNEMNEVLFFGKGTPRQAVPDPGCSFYEDWMGKYYIEYDPERANKLLDEMGLKWDKKHQYRLRPDGKTLALTIEYNQSYLRSKPYELIKEYWEKIGVKVTLKGEQDTFYKQRLKANECDVGSWKIGGASEIYSRCYGPIRYRPPWHWSGTPLGGVEWWNWYNTNGKTGEEPPEEIKRLYRIVDEWLVTPRGTKKYLELGKEILTINVKGLYLIGTIGLVPRVAIIKNKELNTLAKTISKISSNHPLGCKECYYIQGVKI